METIQKLSEEDEKKSLAAYKHENTQLLKKYLPTTVMQCLKCFHEKGQERNSSSTVLFSDELVFSKPSKN